MTCSPRIALIWSDEKVCCTLLTSLEHYLGNLPHCWNVYYLAVNNITIQHHADVEHTPPRAWLVRSVLGDDLALAEHLSNGALANSDISKHDNVGGVDRDVFIVSDVVADAGNHWNTTEGGKVLVQEKIISS